MSVTKLFCATAVAAACVAAPSLSQAALVVYNSQAAFLAAVASSAIDNYNSLPATNQLIGATLNRSSGGFSYRASAPNGLWSVGPNAADRWLSVDVRTDTLKLDNFSSNVAGVGGFFFGTDVNGAEVSVNLTVVGKDGTTATQSIMGSSSTFLGFVSDSQIVEVDIFVPLANQPAWPTVNNLILGAQLPSGTAPEPGTFALVGLAAFAAATSRRRRVA